MKEREEQAPKSEQKQRAALLQTSSSTRWHQRAREKPFLINPADGSRPTSTSKDTELSFQDIFCQGRLSISFPQLRDLCPHPLTGRKMRLKWERMRKHPRAPPMPDTIPPLNRQHLLSSTLYHGSEFILKTSKQMPRKGDYVPQHEARSGRDGV